MAPLMSDLSITTGFDKIGFVSSGIMVMMCVAFNRLGHMHNFVR